VVWGESTESGDVDLIIEFEEEKSLIELAGLRLELEELTGRRLDVLAYDSLSPLLRERILAEQEAVL